MPRSPSRVRLGVESMHDRAATSRAHLSLYEGDQRVSNRHKYKIVFAPPKCHRRRRCWRHSAVTRGLIRCTVSRTFPGTRLGELRERLLIASQARKATPGTINRPSPPLAFNNRNSRQFFPEPMVRVWVRVVRFSFDVAKGRVQASRFDEVRSCVQSQCIES